MSEYNWIPIYKILAINFVERMPTGEHRLQRRPLNRAQQTLPNLKAFSLSTNIKPDNFL